jgi:polyhydroxyalkanoate synthesis regulator phasin
MDTTMRLRQNMSRQVVAEASHYSGHKIGIVVDGVQMLAEKMERLDERVDGLEKRVEDLAVGLAAHRADTRAHPRVHRINKG